MDFDEPLLKKNSLLSWQRRWNRVPKLFRFYLVLIIVFVAFTFTYYLFIVSQKNDYNEKNEAKIDIEEHQKMGPENEQNVVYTHLKKPVQDESSSEDEFLTRKELMVAASKQNEQQKQIRDEILNSFQAYHKYAWGRDFLKPITKKGQDWYGIGLTLLDSLDTLLFAGLDDEFQQALQWIRSELTFDVNQNVNCFETTIRALAGLLSAYHITKEKILLDKSIDLGERLIHCFDSPSHMVPYSDVNLKTKTPRAPSWSIESSLSEVSSVQLEFRDLSRESGNDKFEKKSFTTSEHLHDLVLKRSGFLLPMYINPLSGNLVPSTITLGARADSYYEYLYKQYLQTNIEFLLEDYIKSIAAIKNKLMQKTNGKLGLTFFGEILVTEPQSLHPKMDHLVCFLSGTLALGYYHEYEKKYQNSQVPRNETFKDHLKMAEDLARTCHYMYNLTETGLAPEIGYFQDNFDEEFYIKPRDTHNLLRPEFVESLFFLYHITKDAKYRQWGEQVFQAFKKYCKINSGGYTTINDVRHPNNLKPKDFMESFWLAETLKYLYLLFEDDEKIIDKLLNRYIFNTEGHILPRRTEL